MISFTFQPGYFLLLPLSNRCMFAKGWLFNTRVHFKSTRRKFIEFTVSEDFKCVCTWLVHVCVTNAGLNFSNVQRSHWEHDGGLLRSGGLPIVVLTSGRILLFTVSTDLLQHTGDIWSSPATVNHPDTARLEHIVSTNPTQTDLNRVSVRVYLAVSSWLWVD